jgi:hypothetical protein
MTPRFFAVKPRPRSVASESLGAQLRRTDRQQTGLRQIEDGRMTTTSKRIAHGENGFRRIVGADLV